MSFASVNPKINAEKGRRFRLNIVGLTDRRIYCTALGDDADAVKKYIESANKAHFENNGIVDRTPDQVNEFMIGRLNTQVLKIETEFFDSSTPARDEVEVTDGEWLPAGEQLYQRLYELDYQFVIDPIIAYTRNRANFLPNNANA